MTFEGLNSTETKKLKADSDEVEGRLYIKKEKCIYEIIWVSSLVAKPQTKKGTWKVNQGPSYGVISISYAEVGQLAS